MHWQRRTAQCDQSQQTQDHVCVSVRAARRRTSRKVWARDVLGELSNGDVRVMYQGSQACYHLPQVVGWDLGGNPDSNPSCTIHQQVWNPGWKHCGLIL